MGGFMSIFSPPSPPPPPPPVVIPAVTQTAGDASQDNAAQDERKARLAAVARNKAGLAGTVATSPRGVLTPTASATQRKSLLGE